MSMQIVASFTSISVERVGEEMTDRDDRTGNERERMRMKDGDEKRQKTKHIDHDTHEL